MQVNHPSWEARRLLAPKRGTDVRSEWERDYARLIHSSAFRRLQSKTQVLGLGESDFYRTRLTHSMEVAQIGAGIVRWVCHFHSVRGEEEIVAALPDPSLVSSICLAHDIGHPPFGHGGEVALNLCMRDHGGFEGNGQTLRILSKLDKYSVSNGLNATRRMLLGVLKYPAPYSQVVRPQVYGEPVHLRWLFKADMQHPPKCYLDDEMDVVEWVLSPLEESERNAFVAHSTVEREGKHFKTLHKALDTSIMELADDISYAIHDLEDAISLRMISREDWDEHNAPALDIFRECGEDSAALGTALFARESHVRKDKIGYLVNLFITKVTIGESAIQFASCDLIRWNAQLSASHKRLLEHIKALVMVKVISSSTVQQLEFKGQKLIVELFDVLHSDPERLLPENTRTRYLEAADGTGSGARVLCDFIAGMTDEYATRLYEKFMSPHKGSIFDRQ